MQHPSRLIEQLQKVIAAGPVGEAQLSFLQEEVASAIPKLRAAVALRNQILRPGRFICHRDQTYGFVVMILAWGPGDGTPIHDHGIWGVEGVLEGALTVTDYNDSEVAPEPLLQKIIGPGATMSNLPPKRDVHRVQNCARGLSLSLHIYGREITGNRIFVPGKGFEVRNQKADEYAFLDVAGIADKEELGWSLFWNASSML